ncbi:MAG: carboxypeptidase regulatory-like domain-containing protein [Gammaproteobacteria bacterium]|nr:carboxypeptidase regulatory-like domain-containing protein [Gammaproteobacteria bacterium]
MLNIRKLMLPQYLAVTAIFCLSFVTLVSTPAHAANAVDWAQAEWNVNANAGQTVSRTNTITANLAISNFQVLLSKSIAKFATIEYGGVESLANGQTLTLTLIVTPSETLAKDTVTGSIVLFGKAAASATEFMELPSDVQVASLKRKKLTAALQSGARPLSAIDVSISVEHSGTGTISVQTFYEGKKNPAAAGIPVYLDNELVGETLDNGVLDFQATAGKHRVTAFDPYLAGAGKLVTIRRDTTKTVKLLMTGAGLAVALDHRLTGDLSPVVPASTSELSVTFRNSSGSALVPTQLGNASVEQVQTGTTVDVTDRFEILGNGEIRTVSEAYLGDILGVDGEQILHVSASTANGTSLDGTLSFRVGRYSLSGQVVAPPSNPELSTQGAEILFRVLGTKVEAFAATAADGSFTLTGVPAGNVAFELEHQEGEVTYSSSGALFVTGATQLEITLLGPEDYVNGVPPFSIISAPALLKPRPMEMQRRRKSAKAPDVPRAPPQGLVAAATAQVTISAAADFEDQRVQDTATLLVPMGTKKLELTYQVITTEYPEFVLSQSIFNDVWDLAVVANDGTRLFSISRNVNSQVSLEPFWDPTGSTGLIKESLDVSLLTVDQDAAITVTGSATNIGDDILPTYVDATLAVAGQELNIQLIMPGSDKDGTFFSVPRRLSSNHFHKWYDFKIISPAGVKAADITNVTVKLLLGAGDTLGKTAFSGKPITAGYGPREFRVPVTFGGDNPRTSPVNGTPPEAHNIKYEFQFEATVNGEPASATLYSGSEKALWRMPDGILRYGGKRDVGGDDWASKGTFEWLETYGSLITRINDISGEHGRNIGHAGHKSGTDIDIFHFGDVLYSAGTDDPFGLLNYLAAEELATNAVLGDEAATEELRQWILDQRTGLANLASNPIVGEVFTIIGRPHDPLPSGWAWGLIRDGKITAADNTVLLELDAGATLSSTIKPLLGHDDHYHIDLNESLLNEDP